MHLSQKNHPNSADVEVLHMKTTQVFFPEPCYSCDIFPTIATTCGFMFSELRTSHLKSHRWEHCPLSGFVSDQIFAAPGFSGLHRKKASACAGATVTDQLVPCDLGLSAGWTGNLCMGVVDGIESAEKSAESIVYVRFKYVYCKNIQLIISFISISYSTSVINIKILSFSASLGDAARTQFVNLKKKNSTAMTQAPANKRHFATAKAL